MLSYFQVGEWLFYPHKNEIHCKEEVFKIRPKTAEVFKVLLQANGEIVSKHDLLQQVWNDVIVEEHVVFQSMTELRKIFKGTSTIKTHPRKGYSISETITEIDMHSGREEPASSIRSRFKLDDHKKYYYLAPLIVCLSLLLLLAVKYSTGNHVAKQGSVMVLPVTNRIEDSEHMWVKYGGMDLLIKYLQPQLDAPVLPTEEVLDTLKRVDVNQEEFDEVTVSRLFEVSGAEVIVVQAMSGYSGDYQLVYSIYKKGSITRGALFADNTNQLYSDLYSLILHSMGVNEISEIQTYQHNFANEMLANAIDEMQSDSFTTAVTMLQAVLVTEPENLLASRMLVKSLVYLNKYEEAKQAAKRGIEYAIKNDDTKNLGRLLFWQALSTTQQRQFDEALAILYQVKIKSKQTNDLLYLANTYRVIGKIHLHKKRFSQAREAIFEALRFYQTIQEPYGQSSMHIDLGELALAEQDWQAAMSSFNTALALATKSNISQLVAMSNEWIAKTNEARNDTIN
ncbi:winged helix-turn-helix domain-containing protein [Pseudoalteromonas sp. MMG005]|uniref:winged helix-turn-helix domain-containing protein n=1 Tax=Pseudoalteromonas sp. MMG005 TaxID=2822682 RepID=UPI001B3A4188|nr:winged helix-turn-helix domain-containing protein [Pseudoalteromonas sp. MMG005]MBQ4847604.1 winged helix-turn-helix domain-containing protein [Pseudoalteromonas sp. MMG005]